ncbi:SSU ribosomal protein S8p (S15Ae) [hydrothermal vent metagenome]|uniref:SSU ribosomal protein S8p (S15Ae) n=1 Tax=hydrothermal vent metagenome TaxID=652676 RepID=A0A1W1DQ17_9ZZZZ
MSMSDPVADMLTRIRNAHMVDKKEVNIPASNLKSAIASVMQQEGYIESFSVDGEAASKTLTIKLKYYDDKPVIDSLQRISKPSLRVYVKSTEMPSVMNGLGIVIVSTPKGVMTGQNAAAQNVGGEVLCSVS